MPHTITTAALRRTGASALAAVVLAAAGTALAASPAHAIPGPLAPVNEGTDPLAPPSEVPRSLEVSPQYAECGDWAARYEPQPLRASRPPVRPARLVVTGRCLVPSGHYSVHLLRQIPQGINPSDLLLKLVVYRHSGPAVEAEEERTRPLRAFTWRPVRFDALTRGQYDTVTVLPHGGTHRIKDAGNTDLETQ